MFLGGVITCALVGFISIFLGYLIWIKKELSIIAGFNDKIFKGDRNKLAKAYGLFAIFIGILTFILPFALEFDKSVFVIIYTIIVILGSIFVRVYAHKLNNSKIK
ncbi:DUF3784 domain-containing protein [Metabacillus fastidiosus]|uniref:DUF3784 domain-containing protein n=1 Tax=Metabacillus fastidiosus TaxID=1458 RepID=UPI003D2687F9